MEKVYIVAAKRTAVGSFLGAIKDESPAKLATTVLRAAIEDSGVKPEQIDEVILGNVMSASHGQNIARQASLAAGIPDTVPAHTINMLCDSGMKAIINGFQAIKSGEAKLIMAGGTESMSMAPFLLPYTHRTGSKFGDIKVTDYLLETLTDDFNKYHMGVTAENLAELYGISREEQDSFALHSQQRAVAAIECKRFEDEIVPYIIEGRKGDVVFTEDEYPNKETSLEKLSALRPAFKSGGTVTAGNASGINDGASVVMLASESALAEYGLTAIGEVVAVAQTGCAPEIMGLGPVESVKRVLAKANLTIEDMDLLEINEAFAAQALAVVRQLQKDLNFSASWLNERLNVNGGAIALGHPLGASGNRITVSLLHEMKKRQSTYGIASLCAGGGMGTAVIIKNI